ncbi:MAG: MBL fold metallo-hydrolase [Proteobacteria bacterium]|nr:MBL fold metallo-hydrolase [Pseudomonadota bacterium]
MIKKTTVRVAFIDVGQGDTIVVSVPETHEAVIIDCIDAEAVISYLEKYDIRHVRGLILTHLHLDHCKGMMGFIANAKSQLNLICERVFFCHPYVNEKIWQRLQNDGDGHSDISPDETSRKRRFKDIRIEILKWAQSHRDRFKRLTKQVDISSLPLPGIIELVHPWEVDIDGLIGKSLNDISAVLKINGNGTSAILTGDLEPAGWNCLRKNKTEISGDVLKFPHHGAWKDSNPEDLLNTISPSVVVVSVGTDGDRYNHPNPHVFKTLNNHPDIRVLCTQATSQCIGEIDLKQKNLIKRFKQYCSETDAFFVEQKGCPCAGTIIIELGDSLKILQPNIEFHKDQIIKSYFHTPKCC